MNIYQTLQLFSLRQKLRQRDHWSRIQLVEHQTHALKLLRNYAYAHSPFYQWFHKGLSDRPLNELPVLTKALMMKHFDEFVTDRAIRRSAVGEHIAAGQSRNRFLDRYLVLSTSGSTGLPGFFLLRQRTFKG